MILVKVNNTPHQINANSSLENLLHTLDIATNGIAVAINLHVITRSDWKTKLLHEGDDVLIIKATQGG